MPAAAQARVNMRFDSTPGDAVTSLGTLYFPYCLKRHEHGSYVIQDRFFHPIAFFWIEHQYTRVYIEGLTPEIVKKLSYTKRKDREEIYLCDLSALYGTGHPAAIQAYMQRLALLATLQVRPDYTSRVMW